MTPTPQPAVQGIVERHEQHCTILAPAHQKPFRRVLYVNSYGGAAVWNKIKQNLLPPQHLWGCIELVRMGYEVALAEPLPDFYLYRRPLPHDCKFFKLITGWLGRDGIVYCGHNVLHWIPVLKALRILRCKVVSNLWAREPLDFAAAHDGIITLTQAGYEHAKKLNPKAKIARLGWGCCPEYYPNLPYEPESFLSCGITNRDHRTLSLAAAKCKRPLRLICPKAPEGLNWPPNVTVIETGRGWNVDEKKVGYGELLNEYYARSAGSVVPVKRDDHQYIACGMTEVLEAMAMARPVILTRTGALPTEIDVEKAGCGLHVAPEDPDALAKAIETLVADPTLARAMGMKGRMLIEKHYNMRRFAGQLHQLFESL